jgi:uncharacterized protein
VTWEIAAGVAAVALGGTVQSGTGFGFALIAAPVLTALFDPRASVTTLALLGPIVAVMTLTAERRPLRVLRRPTVLLTLWSLPGMAAGALVLRHAPSDLLRVLVAMAVLVAVWVTARVQPVVAAEQRGAGEGALAGALSGAMATSTGLNGPPLVLHLLRRGAEPDEMRDTLAAFFLVAALLTVVALVVAGTFRVAPGLGFLMAGTALGQLVGRRVFERIHAHHRAVTLGVLVVSALVALVPAAQALVG